MADNPMPAGDPARMVTWRRLALQWAFFVGGTVCWIIARNLHDPEQLWFIEMIANYICPIAWMVAVIFLVALTVAQCREQTK